MQSLLLLILFKRILFNFQMYDMFLITNLILVCSGNIVYLLKFIESLWPSTWSILVTVSKIHVKKNV